MGDQYTLGALLFDTTTFKDVKETGIAPNNEVLRLGGSGNVYDTFAAITKSRPQFPFITGDIKTALATLGGMSGLGFAASELVAYWKKAVDGGSIAGTLGHIKHTVEKGLIVPTQLTIPSSGQALANYIAHMISSDGSTSPYTIQENQTLPVGTGAADTLWLLNSVNINGTALNDVQQVTIDFGINVQKFGSKQYDDFSCYFGQVIRITITARDAAAFASWDIGGVVQGATDSTIIIDDIDSAGLRGASPITATIDAGLIHTDNITAQHQQPVENSIVFEVTYDGTAAPIVFSGLS